MRRFRRDLRPAPAEAADNQAPAANLRRLRPRLPFNQPRTANVDSRPLPRLSVAPPSTSPVVSAEEAERYVKEFNRDMERGDLQHDRPAR